MTYPLKTLSKKACLEVRWPMVTSIKGKSQDQRKRKLNEDAGASHAGMLNPPKTSPSPAHCDVLLLEYEPQPSHWPGGDCENQAFILEMPK